MGIVKINVFHTFKPRFDNYLINLFLIKILKLNSGTTQPLSVILLSNIYGTKEIKEAL